MAKKAEPSDVSIGKFDILATYTYAQALADGLSDADARHRGAVVAILGAQARSGAHRDHAADATDAERKHKSSITAETFDRQVSDKMGSFFGQTFLPAMKEAVELGLSYDEVKRAVKIPSTWGAKISGTQFHHRWKKATEK